MRSLSFSADVKNELARLSDTDNCCKTAELAALLRMGGTMLIGGGASPGVGFTTENAAVARKALQLVKKGFHLKTEVMVSRSRRLKKNNSYSIRVPPSPLVAKLLKSLGILQDDRWNGGRDARILRKTCCRRAYLRGAFLGGGSVSKPSGEYHLELVTGSFDFAGTLVATMRNFALPVRLTDRKGDYVVYLKDGDAITSFLRVIGAGGALLAFENVRVVKDMRNQVNRLVNCETANLQKTVNAALRQVEHIRRLIDRQGLHKLPPTLRETAEARLAHPEATLQELVAALGHRVGKSGVNHRLRKLERLARALDEPPGGP